jgi:hypothetical protein
LAKPKTFFHGIAAFEDSGRAFEVYVAWGKDASAPTKRTALAVLDSLTFDPGPMASSRPHCGTLDLGGGRYNIIMFPTVATPGEEVVLSGPTLRDEGGRFYPASRIEVWFNTSVPKSEVPNGAPIRSGPILHLATVYDMNRCTFSTHFAVPDVAPGRYKIFDFVFYKGGYGGSPHLLTVA